MFDINVFFTNFKDRNGYKELSQKLQNASELEISNNFVKLKNFTIPMCNIKDELNDFPKELEKMNWGSNDIELVKTSINIYKNNELKDDLEAFSLCMLCKALFPEKTELFDLIIEDLEKGTDNRSMYVNLFDLQSDIVNLILFYMS